MTISNIRRVRIPLLVKMLVLVLLATLTPLLIFGAMSIRGGTRAVAETAKQNLQLVAHLTATRLDQLFIDTQRLQTYLATSPEIIAALSAPPERRAELFAVVERRLRDLLASNPDLALAYIADANGICRVSTSPDMVGRDYKATRDYMRSALAGQSSVSELAMGITTREPGVFFSGPIPPAPASDSSPLLGAVVLKLKGSVLDRICGDVNAQITHGFAALIDARQVIISHPETSMLYHSLGKLSPQDAARINPKLQYGLERIEPAGWDNLAQALSRNTSRGNLDLTSPNGDTDVGGFARLAQRPWTLVVLQNQTEFDRPLRDLTRQLMWAIGILGLISLMVAGVATYGLLRPVKALRDAARQAAQGDWSARARVLSRDEIGDLAATFNDMMPKLQERSKMQHALRLAMDIQRHLLPSVNPEIAGLEVSGANIAADETGGDYYDFLDLSAWKNGTLAVAIGDVTGHGVSAALLMATARALLRSRATPPGLLAELISDVNNRLCDDTPDGRFMTLLYTLLDRPNQSLRLVSAGHDPVLVYDPATDRFEECGGDDVPLGLQPNWIFSEFDFHLPNDAILLFGTDGIWETFSPDGEAYGKDRLMHVLRTHALCSSEEIRDAILRSVSEFRGAHPQKDDVTVVVIRLTPLPTQNHFAHAFAEVNAK